MEKLITDWKKQLESENESVLCWGTRVSGKLEYRPSLKEHSRPLDFHTIDRTLLHMIVALIRKGGELLVAYPVSNMNILVPLALESVYSIMEQELSGSRKKVLLLSERRYDIIDQYTALTAGGISIHNMIFPLAESKRDGTIQRVRGQLQKNSRMSELEQNPRLILSSDLKSLPSKEILKEIGAGILDLRIFRSSSELRDIRRFLLESGIPAIIYLENNVYSEPFTELVVERLPLWGWSDDMLFEDYKACLSDIEKNPAKYENPFALSAAEIRRRVEGYELREYIIRDTKLDSIFVDLDAAINALVSNRKASNFSAAIEARNISVRVVSYCKNLLSRLQNYDNELHMMRQLSLQDQTDILLNLAEATSSYDISISQQIELLHEKLQTALGILSKELPPKAKTALSFCQTAIEEGKSLGVVCLNGSHAQACKIFLSSSLNIPIESLEEKHIFVIGRHDVERLNVVDLCVFAGPLYRDSMHLYRLAPGKKVLYLLYSCEESVFRHQIIQDNLRMAKLLENSKREATLSGLLGKPVKLPVQDTAKLKPVRDLISSTESGHDGSFFESLLNLEVSAEQQGQSLADLQETYEAKNKIEVVGADLVVKCLKIIFSDKTFICIPRGRTVPVLGKDNDIDYLDAAHVKPGDVVVVINNGIKQSLADYIFEIAQHHPRLQSIVQTYQMWLYYFNDALAKSGDNFEVCLTKLKEKGTDIKTPTAIYFWAKGFVLQMRNKKNIQYLGEIYNIDYFKKNYDHIYACMGRLQKIHRNILGNLSELITKAGVHAKLMDHGVIDEELHLSIDQFRDAISLKKVEDAGKEIMMDIRFLNKCLSEQDMG